MDTNLTTQEDEHGNIHTSLDYFLKCNMPKSTKILDVGCGYGSLAYNLFKMGYTDTFGIEVNEDRIQRGKKNYSTFSNHLSHYTGKHIPFEDESFDAVLMFDVIEHIPSIDTFIKEEVYRILKPGGSFIFQTPNKFINIPWEIINQRSFTKWKNYHCSLQTRKSLEKILEKSGFEHIVIEKNDVLTQHNKSKVRKKLPFLGIPILYLLQLMPLPLFPNLWGKAERLI